jgi:hypothetical protein
MSGRLLDFSKYLGQANNVQVIEMFPSTQKTFDYDFNANVSAYTFEADMQTIVVDTLAYDRATGDPSFSDSIVVGYFANAEINGNTYIDSSSAATGSVRFTIPSQRYTGPLTPDARTNVAITVASIKWTDTGATPNTTDSHRWAIIERYEPDVSPGNPRLSNVFIPLGTGSITAFTTDASTDGDRVPATYNSIGGLTGGDSEGSGATFQFVVGVGGATDVNIQTRGSNFTVGDTIKVLDSDLGGGGAADVTITVTGIS